MKTKTSNKEFDGKYKDVFDDYCTYRKAMGFKVNIVEFYALKRINIFLNSFNTDSVCLKKEYIEEYLTKYKDKKTSTKHNVTCMFRCLGKYMYNNGYDDVYIIPENMVIKQSDDFTPYIFTTDEIKTVFEAIDNYIPSKKNPIDLLFYQAIYRLLYATGLRVGEALNLKVGDVDLEKDIITIYNSKDNVSRLVPFLPSLHYWLDKYNKEKVKNRYYFFQNKYGQKINQLCIYNNFVNKFLPLANINPQRGNGHYIRVHDLRHTFACHSLDKAVKQGKDSFCVLPYLSTYMGHKDIKSTEIYLRLTSDHFEEILDVGHYIYKELEENE